MYLSSSLRERYTIYLFWLPTFLQVLLNCIEITFYGLDNSRAIWAQKIVIKLHDTLVKMSVKDGWHWNNRIIRFVGGYTVYLLKKK